ncbi:MAG TPA: pilus assembly protein PilM [Luteitalea sp.]|nr:pilus assembly protein PilM [Luteitalea sp.]
MSPLPAWLQTPPPTLGLQIDTHRVTAVLVEAGAASPVVRGFASAPLPSGALVPSLTAHNVHQRDAIVSAMRRAVEQVGGRHRRVALAIPDTAAKVSLLPFEQIPASPRDLEQLIRLQLRKTVPFPADEAQLAWSRGPMRGTGTTIVVAAMRRDVVQEYEGLCAAAGLHAGTVDLATFNVVNLAMRGGVTRTGDTLVVHATPAYASVAVVRDDEMIFFRTRPADATEMVPDVVHQTRMFYEDRLNGTGFGQALLVASPDVEDRDGLARELQARLDQPVAALDLASVATFSDRVGASDAVVGQIAAATGLLLREVGA